MIYLCTDYNILEECINNLSACKCIEGHMNMYLMAYGCDYDFLQFYLQSEDDKLSHTSIIMRYNNIIYVTSLCSCESQREELSAFVLGFEDCEIISAVKLIESPNSKYYCNIGFIMTHFSCDNHINNDRNISICNDSEVITKLVMQEECSNKYMDFYLNNSHLLRHGLLKSYVVYFDKLPVSVITVSNTDFGVSVVPTVFTHKNFRGNGFSKILLNNCLCEKDREYQLLCEEKNIVFYEKCGFEAIGQWFHYQIRG